MNPYKVLGVPETATADEIKKAFKQLAADLHPDKKRTGNEAKFKEINNAYQMLSTPEERAATDERLRQERSQRVQPFPNPFGVPPVRAPSAPTGPTMPFTKLADALGRGEHPLAHLLLVAGGVWVDYQLLKHWPPNLPPP